METLRLIISSTTVFVFSFLHVVGLSLTVGLFCLGLISLKDYRFSKELQEKFATEGKKLEASFWAGDANRRIEKMVLLWSFPVGYILSYFL